MRALTTIDLSLNFLGQLDEKEGQIVAECLKLSKSLTRVDLSHNNLGEDGGEAIAKVLSECRIAGVIGSLVQMKSCKSFASEKFFIA